MTEFGDIVEGFKAGDPAAWSSLYRHFFPFLVGYLRKHQRLEVQDAEDLASSVLLIVAIQLKAGQLRSPEALAPYIFRLVERHTCLWIRGRYWQREQVPITEDLPIASRAPSPEQTAIRHEQLEAVWRTVKRLTPLNQELFHRVYVLRQSRGQIQRELGLTETQFRLRKSQTKIRLIVWIHRLRAKVRGQMRTLWDLRKELDPK
jgi:RNA polymerase sigma factor (sigma-70 family)